MCGLTGSGGAPTRVRRRRRTAPATWGFVYETCGRRAHANRLRGGRRPPGTFPKRHTLGPAVCEMGTMRRVMVPKRHTLGPTVREMGTMRRVMVPKRRTLGPAVREMGKVPAPTVPEPHALAPARRPGRPRAAVGSEVAADPVVRAAPAHPHKVQKNHKRGTPICANVTLGGYPLLSQRGWRILSAALQHSETGGRPCPLHRIPKTPACS